MPSPDIDVPMPHPFGYDGGTMPSEARPLIHGKPIKFFVYEDLTRGNDTGEDGPSSLTPEEATLIEIREALAALRTEELHNP